MLHREAILERLLRVVKESAASRSFFIITQATSFFSWYITATCVQFLTFSGGAVDTKQFRRPIRSFVRREGRMTPRQERALNSAWPRFGVQPEELSDLSKVFSRSNPVTLEIGFGMGEGLLAMAKEHSETNFLGIEVHRPGVGSLLAGAEAAGINNLKVCTHDVVELFEQRLLTASLNKVMIFFPDPWPKKKHHKRRLLNGRVIRLLHDKVVPGGVVHIATDWQHYAQDIKHQFAEVNLFSLQQEIVDLPAMNPYRKQTKFERRGKRLGHRITDLLYLR